MLSRRGTPATGAPGSAPLSELDREGSMWAGVDLRRAYIVFSSADMFTGFWWRRNSCTSSTAVLSSGPDGTTANRLTLNVIRYATTANSNRVGSPAFVMRWSHS